MDDGYNGHGSYDVCGKDEERAELGGTSAGMCAGEGEEASIANPPPLPSSLQNPLYLPPRSVRIDTSHHAGWARSAGRGGVEEKGETGTRAGAAQRGGEGEGGGTGKPEAMALLAASARSRVYVARLCAGSSTVVALRVLRAAKQSKAQVFCFVAAARCFALLLRQRRCFALLLRRRRCFALLLRRRRCFALLLRRAGV